MSSILKALKKLEAENAARQHDPLKIDTEILRNNTSDRPFPIKAILVGVFLFICGSGITYIYLMRTREIPPSPTRTQGYPASKTTLASSSPMPVEVPVERIEPETIVAAIPEPDTSPNRTVSPKTVATRVPSRQLSEPIRVRQVQSVKTQHFRELAKKNPQTIANKQKMTTDSNSSAAQIPALKVNGIAFQDGVDSVAVVNGVPVSKGSSIEGVRIDDIERDRILFSYGGEKFNIQLGKSNR